MEKDELQRKVEGICLSPDVEDLKIDDNHSTRKQATSSHSFLVK
jgi:hypothetical protein